MTLLNPIKNTSILTTYKQFYMQSLHKSGRLIPEQNKGEMNPLFQQAFDPHPPLDPISRTTVAV
jgi:hypothetical protein